MLGQNFQSRGRVSGQSLLSTHSPRCYLADLIGFAPFTVDKGKG